MTIAPRNVPTNRAPFAAISLLAAAAIVVSSWSLFRVGDAERDSRSVRAPSEAAAERTSAPSSRPAPPSPEPITSDAATTRERAEAVEAVASKPREPVPEFAILEGRVTGAGERESMRDWAVAVSLEGEFSVQRAAFVESGDRYRVDGIRPDRPLVLRVKADGEVIHHERLPPLPAGVTRHDVEVRPIVLARGRVVDADTSAPIAKARVGVEFVRRDGDDSGERSDQRYSYAETRSDGTFELRGAPPSSSGSSPVVILTASRLGHFSTIVEHTLDDLSSLGPIELRIGALGTLAGRLVDAGGIPIEGATIDVSGPEPGRPIRGGEPCAAFDAKPSPAGNRTVVVHAASARTDRDGEFALKGIAHGAQPTLVVRIGAREFRYRTESRFERCGELKRIEIRMPPASGRVAGRVTRGGQPFAADLLWRGTRFEGESRSDDLGSFLLENVESGRVVVIARDSITGAEVATAVIVEGNTRIDLDIPFGPVVAGFVRWEDRSPVAGVPVTATLDSIFDPDRSVVGASAVTDASGAFELRLEDLSQSYRVTIPEATLRALGATIVDPVRAPPGATGVVLELRR